MAAGQTNTRVGLGREDSHGPAGEVRLERALDAAHSLSDLLWEELHEQLRCAHAREDHTSAGDTMRRRTAQLAERMADVASTVALLASGDPGAARTPDPGTRNARRAPAGAAAVAKPAPVTRPVAVLIDERDELQDCSRQESAAAARRGLGRRETTSHTLRRDSPSPERFWTSNGRRAHDGVEKEHDRGERRGWLGQIDGALAQFERDHVPFAALLIEVLDAGVQVEVNRRIARTVAGALESLSPPSIVPECSNRCWLLVPRADRRRARVVAARLTRALGPSANPADRPDAAEKYFAAISARRSPPRSADDATHIRLAIGTAVCPEDGRDVPSLVAQAHIDLAATRSASAPLVAVGERVQR